MAPITLPVNSFLIQCALEYAVISCSSTNYLWPPVTGNYETPGRNRDAQTSFTMESGAVKVCWEKEGIRIKKFLEKGNSM